MIVIKGMITKTRTSHGERSAAAMKLSAGAFLIEVDADKALTRRFRQQADSEYGLSALVQHFHPPFGVLLQAAGNAAEKVGTHLGHCGPGGLVALKLRALIGCAGIATMTYLEKI
jgi:hypothetical protein